MPGPNLTGRPNSNDLWIGRGEVFFSILDANDMPVKWRHLGNCPQFSMGTAIETKEHFSSMAGLKSQDKSVVLSDARTITMQLEEMSGDNQALFFSGDQVVLSGSSNSAIAGFSEHLMVADGDLQAGTWYEIKNAAGVRAMNIDGTLLTVKTNEGPPNTLIEGVDYDLNAEFGMIFMRADSTDVTDAVAIPVGLLVTLAADSGAGSINEVRGVTHTPIVGAVRFCGENAATGDKMEFEFHKVRLKASGDTSLISEDWRTVTLEGSLESSSTNYPDSPFFDIRTLGEALPQLIMANVEYDAGNSLTGGGAVNLFFDKPLNINQAFVAVSGAIKFRTAATLSGSAAGDEGEYWLNAGNFSDGMGTISALPLVPEGYYLSLSVAGNFTLHATTLASAETVNVDASGIGLSVSSGVPLPIFAGVDCPSNAV